MTAIRRTIVVRLLVNSGFVLFDVRSFTRRQFTRMNSLIDAILLAILPRVHAHPLWVRRSPMVHRRIIAAVDPRGLPLRNLIRSASEMLFVHRRAFPGGWHRMHAALAVKTVVVVVVAAAIHE